MTSTAKRAGGQWGSGADGPAAAVEFLPDSLPIDQHAAVIQYTVEQERCAFLDSVQARDVGVAAGEAA